MTKPEKRWQLLLVADDGRIIPFKRIKGIAVTLLILLVLMGVVCLGMGWQLTRANQRHQRVMDQLAEMRREAAHYKREHELVAAELVLAEARMEKAGLEVTRRQRTVPEEGPAIATAGAAAVPVEGADAQASAVPAADRPTVASADPPPSPAADPPTETTVTSGPAAVDLENFVITHDVSRSLLQARFRVNNTGPPSAPVAGRCVVVLKRDPADPDAWLPLPQDALSGGKPDARRGRPFKISRFIDMDIVTAAMNDPSDFKLATVYVLDPSGEVLLQRDYPVDLPAAKTETAPASIAATAAGAAVGGDAADTIVEVSEWAIQHDTARRILRAQFRVTATGPSSAPVEGRCVVVLKSERLAPDAWVAMPDVTLTNGLPGAGQGPRFSISRFRDMEIETAVKTDPSVFDSATLYVLDEDGEVTLEKKFTVALPAPIKPPASVSSADAPITTESATGDQSPAAPEDTALPTTQESKAREDNRSRF